jgi:hypothetical protein
MDMKKNVNLKRQLLSILPSLMIPCTLCFPHAYHQTQLIQGRDMGGG